MVRALASHARGRGFESLYLYHITVLHCKTVSSYLQIKDDVFCGTEHLTCSNGQRRYLCCCSMCRFPAMWVARCVCLPGGRCRFFFMVSGYFTYGAVQRQDAGRLVHRMRRLLSIFVPAAGFYALWCCFLLSDKTPAAFFKSHYAMKNVVSFFLLNNTQSKPHLWFIPALIYCYGVVLLLMKMHRTHWLRWAPLLLLVPLVLGEVAVGMLHREVAAQYSRNAWFTGLPCFALGLMFKEAETQIKRLGRKWPALGVLVGLALSVLEYRYLNDSADLYLGPLVAAVSLFLLAQNVTCTWENPFVLYAEGSALAIYILHPALRNLAQRQLLPWWGVRGMAADWLLPVLTLALALLAAEIWLWLKGLWNKRKTRQVTA